MDKMHIDAWLALDIPSARVVHREPSDVYDDAREVSGWSMTLPQPMWTNPEGIVTAYENGADTMYTVNGDFSHTPRIVADLGARRMNAPAVEGVDSGMAIADVMESGRYILFTLLDGDPFGRERPEMHLMSFDKTTGARAFAPKSDDRFFEGPANDIDGGGGTAHMWGYDGETWYAQYDAFRMIEKLTPEHFEKVRPTVKYPDRLEKLQAFVATLTEDDNPVVAIVHLKK